MAATPATSSGASGSPQAMSPCPRAAARRRNAEPGRVRLERDPRGRAVAVQGDREPQAPEQRDHGGDDPGGERRERPRPGVRRELRRGEDDQARARDGGARDEQDDAQAARQRLAGGARPGPPALREHEQRQPERRHEVDPRPGGEREPVVREAVEVQRRGPGGEPDEDDHGREAGGDPVPRAAAQHVGEEPGARDVGRAERVGRHVRRDRPREQLSRPAREEQEELHGVGEEEEDDGGEPAGEGRDPVRGGRDAAARARQRARTELGGGEGGHDGLRVVRGGRPL